MCPSLQAELPRSFRLTIQSIDAEDWEITPAQPSAPCFPPYILKQICSLSSLKPEEDPLLPSMPELFCWCGKTIGEGKLTDLPTEMDNSVFWILSIYVLLKGFSTSLQWSMWYEMVLTAHAGHPSHFSAPQITC